jgi:hypothetical protein
VARAGQCVLGRLCELQWAELDAQAVTRYWARQAPGSVVADGDETLTVASRLGTLQLPSPGLYPPRWTPAHRARP